MPLSTGQILNNRYRIVKLLGQGGFGAVYRAWDMTFELPCALKENIEITEAAQRQFLREAKLLRTLRHPNLPQVTDYFIVPGQGQYLVMDFVAGEDLQEKLDLAGGFLSEAQVLPWISQVCDALSYLHSQNPPVIHRDIKPANIKITPEGKAMLVDFGIAKEFDPNLRTTMGARAVTSGYSPPEQYGRGVTDAQSDVYALGATLYHLLTSQAPPDSVDIMTKNATHPSPVQALNPAVSPATSAAIEKAMRLDRGERWSSVQAFKAALAPNPIPNQVGAATAQVMPVGMTQTSGYTGATSTPLSSPRRLPWGWIAIIGLVVLAALFLILRNVSIRGITYPASQVEVTQPIIHQLPTTQTPSLKFITDSHGVKMALVPAGEFQMGSENGGSDSKPVHIIYLDAFSIDVYEVTNRLYDQCVQAGACTEPNYKSSATRSSYYSNSEYDDFPVIKVDWQQAKTYCEWRGGGLPTEAQWEKAARGASDPRAYPWGDENPSCNMANSYDEVAKQQCVGDTSQVGSYPAGASPYGVLDMAGNVYEWVNDWWQADYYNVSPSSNPPGPTTGSQRVLRGGGWETSWDTLRVAPRDFNNPEGDGISVGFRCATLAGLVSPQASPSPAPTQTIQEPGLTNTPQSLAQIKTDSHGVKMALVPAGEFQMGSENGRGDEKPEHTVYLDTFYIDIYEVTNSLHAQCVRSGACTEPHDRISKTRSSYYGNSQYDDYPVIWVDWQQAKTYCEWRGGGLPTEAQWEKAARGASDTRTYPWGDGNPSCTLANSYDDTLKQSCVGDTTQGGRGSYPAGASPYGVMNMAGNVWEWVNDWYQSDYFSVSPSSNPQGPSTGSYRVLQGGGWFHEWDGLRVSSRYYVNPGYSYYDLGFRCAVPPGP